MSLTAAMKKLPVDIQSIERILAHGKYVYVDKTAYAYQLIQEDASNYFLSRPRRFGKSLFVSTLKEIFKGNKALFQDCAICQTDYDWQPYPVIHIDFYEIDTRDAVALEESIKRYLRTIAETFSVQIETPTAAEGFKSLILQLHTKHQRPVVVLVDEYDKPILRNLRKQPIIEEVRIILEDLFGMLKSLNSFLHFTFMTGVSRFSKVSLFTAPNNLDDITMNPDYATMLGYTEAELRSNFAQHIQTIADQRGTSTEDVFAEIKQWYNGYRFSDEEAYVYNPFSTLRYLKAKKPKSYWYTTGTPTFLVKELQNYAADNTPLEELTATESALMDNSTVEEMDLKALMFQTGYLTIEDYDAFGQLYSLAFPNQEVRQAFVESLAKQITPTTTQLAHACSEALNSHQLTPFFEAITSTMSGFPHWLFSKDKGQRAQEESTARERTYHLMLLSLLKGIGLSVAAEVLTSQGRIDLVIQLPKTTYIFEIKLNRDASAALAQIHAKGYHKAYLNQGKHIALVGINFSSAQRNIDAWLGELYDEHGQLVRPLAAAHPATPQPPAPSSSLTHRV